LARENNQSLKLGQFTGNNTGTIAGIQV